MSGARHFTRVLPGVWRELAGLIQDREETLPALKVAVPDFANPEPRNV